MSDTGVNDQPVSNESDGHRPGSSPGARLAALRQERGWTVEQVASQLNLAPRQILAIERDDYPALPGMAIVRGFIRAYAKLLKVDPAPLLADLGGETVLTHDSLTPQKSLSTPFAESRMPSMIERPGLSSKWVVGSLLIALLVVGVWASRQDDRQVAVPSESASAVNEGGASVASAEADKSASSDVKSEQTLPPQAPTESNAAAPSIPEVAPTAPVPNATPSASPASPVRAAPDDMHAQAGKDMLQLKVREESWIEVRRSGDNSVVLSRIVKAGETENIQVTEPISVVIGNASGVDANLRGSSVQLNANTKSNVARLTLK